MAEIMPAYGFAGVGGTVISTFERTREQLAGLVPEPAGHSLGRRGRASSTSSSPVTQRSGNDGQACRRPDDGGTSGRIRWLSGRSLRFWLVIPKRAFSPRARRSPVSVSSRSSSKRSSRRAMHRNSRWPALGRFCTSFIRPCFYGGCWTKVQTSARRRPWWRLPSNCSRLRRCRFVFRQFDGS